MRSLFDITEDFAELEARLNHLDEIGDDVEALSQLLEWMQDLSSERQQKVDAYCWMIRKLTAEAETAKQVASEFRDKAQVRENRCEMMRTMLYQHMKALGHVKIIGQKFTVAIQKNGGSIPVEIIDEDALPNELCEVRRVPNKTQIRVALESGKEVPGALLGERGESVRIK